MKRLVALLLLLGPGCIPYIRQRQLNEHLASWVGRSEQEMVSQYGPPTTRYPNGAGAVIEWRSTGDTYARAEGSAVVMTTASCREWFDVDGGGRIRSWHWAGNCY